MELKDRPCHRPRRSLQQSLRRFLRVCSRVQAFLLVSRCLSLMGRLVYGGRKSFSVDTLKVFLRQHVGKLLADTTTPLQRFRKQDSDTRKDCTSFLPQVYECGTRCLAGTPDRGRQLLGGLRDDCAGKMFELLRPCSKGSRSQFS